MSFSPSGAPGAIASGEHDSEESGNMNGLESLAEGAEAEEIVHVGYAIRYRFLYNKARIANRAFRPFYPMHNSCNKIECDDTSGYITLVTRTHAKVRV
jgi:hypothetical protein